MTDANPYELGRIPKLVLGLVIFLVVADVLWYGVSAEAVERLWRQLLDRPSGPMSFRFILQPSMAAIAAIHDGVKDARAGRSPYLWAVTLDTRERVGRLREGLTATARIILVGLAMDLAYQLLVFETFYPNEAVYHCAAACIHSLPPDPRPGRAHRALVAGRCVRRKSVRVPLVTFPCWNGSVVTPHRGRVSNE